MLAPESRQALHTRAMSTLGMHTCPAVPDHTVSADTQLTDELVFFVDGERLTKDGERDSVGRHGKMFDKRPRSLLIRLLITRYLVGG